MNAFVFDLGGTFIRCGVLSSFKGVLHQRKSKISDIFNSQNTELVWRDIEGYFCEYINHHSQVLSLNAPIVIAFPGPVVNQKKLLQAPTINKNSEPVPNLANRLQHRTGRNVYFINDLSAAAWYFSRQTTFRRFMVVTISSGIGSKIFDRDNAIGVLDNVPYAGEIGHLTVDHSINAPKCDCGKLGHLGAIASGRGIERAARQLAIDNPTAFSYSLCVQQFSASAKTLNNEDHILPSALLGDNWSLDIVRRSTAPLAQTIATIFLASGLEKIIIIGGFATNLGSIYLNIIREEFLKFMNYEVLPNALSEMIVLGELTEDACLLGAATFAEISSIITP